MRERGVDRIFGSAVSERNPKRKDSFSCAASAGFLKGLSDQIGEESGSPEVAERFAEVTRDFPVNRKERRIGNKGRDFNLDVCCRERSALRGISCDGHPVADKGKMRADAGEHREFSAPDPGFAVLRPFARRHEVHGAFCDITFNPELTLCRIPAVPGEGIQGPADDESAARNAASHDRSLDVVERRIADDVGKILDDGGADAALDRTRNVD